MFWVAVVHKVEKHAADIFDVNKVTGLMPVPILGSVASEQVHAPSFLDLPKGVQNDGCHARLVEFIGAVDIEKLEARPEIGGALLGECPGIKIVFRSSVGVEGLQLTTSWLSTYPREPSP